MCIGQTIDRIVNITHQSARQTTLLDYTLTHAQTLLHYLYSTPLYRKYFMNLRDKDNLRRKDTSTVPKVSFLQRFHCIVQKYHNLSIRRDSTNTHIKNAAMSPLDTFSALCVAMLKS